MDEAMRLKIIEEFGLGGLPRDRQDHYLLLVGDLLFRAVITRATQKLAETDESLLDKLDKLVDTVGEDYTLVLDFLLQNVPGYQQIFTEEIERLKKMSLAVFGVMPETVVQGE